MVAGFGVVASVLVGPWGPAQALLRADDNPGKSSSELKAEKRDVESNIEATEDALAKAGKKVTKAVATFEEVNARWEAAKEDRREALDEARAAREEAQASEARAMRARQALRVAQEQKVVVENIKKRKRDLSDGASVSSSNGSPTVSLPQLPNVPPDDGSSVKNLKTLLSMFSNNPSNLPSAVTLCDVFFEMREANQKEANQKEGGGTGDWGNEDENVVDDNRGSKRRKIET